MDKTDHPVCLPFFSAR